MRKLIFVLIAVSFAFLSACSLLNSSSDFSPAEYFPLKAGNVWEYQITCDNDTQNSVTKGSEGTAVIKIESVSGDTYSLSRTYNIAGKTITASDTVRVSGNKIVHRFDNGKEETVVGNFALADTKDTFVHFLFDEVGVKASLKDLFTATINDGTLVKTFKYVENYTPVGGGSGQKIWDYTEKYEKNKGLVYAKYSYHFGMINSPFGNAYILSDYILTLTKFTSADEAV